MNQTKKIKDGALMLSLFIVLLLISLLVPFLNFISLLLLPVPFVLFASKYNWKPSILLLVAAMILTVLFGSIFSLGIPILMGIGGIMIGSAIYKNMSAYETLARGTFGFIIGLLFLYVTVQVLFQVNFMQELRIAVTESMEMSVALFESIGVENQSAEFQKVMENQINYFINLFPVFLILTAFIFALLSQWISYKILNRTQRLELYFPPFRTLRIPASLLWVYLITLIFSLLTLGESGTIQLVLQNAQMLLSILLTLQGFSFIFYYTHHKRLAKIIPIISIVLAVVFPLFLTLVRLIGIFDIGFNMRERLMRNK